MSIGYGGRAGADPSTMKGRDWPCLRQFGVFLENRVGALNDLMRHLESDDIRVMGLSIVDSSDSAIIRLVLNDYERGCERFRLATFTVFESDVIGVQLPDVPQPFVAICTALLQAEVSIHYSYPLFYQRAGRGSIVLYVDDIDQALNALSENRLTIVTEKDLLQSDEFL